MAPTLMKMLWFVLLIGPLVTIHELGHFLVAKAFGVKVVRFSIGFGPRLLSVTKGETEYQIAALPFGGYVKMAGDDPTESPLPEDHGRGFLEQAPWKRSLISLAGPVVNLVFPVLVFFCVFYFQTTELSSRIGNVDPDSAAYRANLRNGDRIVDIDGHPVRYFEDVRELVSPKWDQAVNIEVERPDGSHFKTTAVPTKTMEPGILHDVPRGILGFKFSQPASIVAIAGPASPAGRAGLLPLDRITSIAGVKVKLFADLEREVAKQNGPFEVEYLRAEPLPTPGAALSSLVLHRGTIAPMPGTNLAARTGISSPERVVGMVEPGSPAARAGLRRGDELVKANAKPLLAWSTLERIRLDAKTTPIDFEVLRAGVTLHIPVAQVDKTQENERGKDVHIMFFGALPEPTDEAGELLPIHRGVLQSTARAIHVVPEMISDVVQAFAGLVTYQISPKTVGSVFMLADIASKTADAGWESFLGAMGAVSVNLGVLNLLPIPIFDGFNVLSAGFEWVRRRPISMRARELTNLVGLAMILAMMVYVLRNDLMRYVFN